MVSSMALQLELVNAMANGGKVGSGYFDIGGTDFKKGFLDPNLKIDELQGMMKKVDVVLNRSNIRSAPPGTLNYGRGSTGDRAQNNIISADDNKTINVGGSGNVAVLGSGSGPYDMRDPITLKFAQE